MQTMRSMAVVGSIWSLVAVATLGATPKAHKLSCKKVHTAVWAGHTIEQLTTEFQTDAAHIMKCLQVKGKKRKSPVDKADKKGATKSQATHATKSK